MHCLSRTPSAANALRPAECWGMLGAVPASAVRSGAPNPAVLVQRGTPRRVGSTPAPLRSFELSANPRRVDGSPVRYFSGLSEERELL
jgi:hypothetical protein